MKKLATLLALAATYSAFSQGTVQFNNWVGINIQAPVTYAAGGPVTAATRANPLGPQFALGAQSFGGQFAQAALYGAPGSGAAESSLVLLIPAVGFRTDIAGAIDPGTSATRTIQGVDAGKPATVQVRAWDAGQVLANNSYEGAVAAGNSGTAVYYGKSALVAISSMGGIPTDGSPPITAPNLTGLGKVAIPMSFVVPEPSIIGLGILGAVAGLMVFRRRN